MNDEHRFRNHNRGPSSTRKFPPVVEDIFCVFDADKFFRLINNHYRNINFTYESNPSKLPFLDVNITTTSGKLERCVYRKPTYMNLVLNFNAFVP